MEEEIDDSISLKDLLLKFNEWIKYIKSKFIYIFFIGILGGVFGFFISKNSDTTYIANLTFALEEKSGGASSGLGSIASQFGLNIGASDGGAFAGENIIELMKSRLLVEKTLLTYVKINNSNKLLVNHYLDVNKTKGDVYEKSKKLIFENNLRQNFNRTQDSILGVLYNKILTKQLEVMKIDKKLSIISVKVKTNNELLSKLFCENLVKNVTDFYIETKIGKSRYNVNLLANKVDSVRVELDKAVAGRAAVADQNQSLIRQSAAVPKVKQEMRIQMLGTMYGELIKNLEFSRLALMREEPLIQIIDTPILPLKKEKYGIIESSLIGFVTFTILTLLYFVISKLYKTYIG